MTNTAAQFEDRFLVFAAEAARASNFGVRLGGGQAFRNWVALQRAGASRTLVSSLKRAAGPGSRSLQRGSRVLVSKGDGAGGGGGGVA
jgi:hypothetical protein